MSITALGFAAVFGLAVALAFIKHPGFGLFAYFWVFYMNPSARWWGEDLPDMRWSLLAALVTMVALLLKGKPASPSEVPPTSGERKRVDPEGTPNLESSGVKRWGLRLLVMLAAWMWIQTAWALDASKNIDGAIQFTKYAVLFWTMCRVLRDTVMVEYFAWMHVLGCLMWGWMARNVPLTQGRLELAFGPGVDDSNVVAFHVLTAVAFAGLMFATCKGLRRWLAFAALPFLLNMIVLTGSRGGLLGIVGAGAAVLFLAPRAHRLFIWCAAFLGAVLLLSLANDTLLGRAQTLTLDQREMDTSAAIRVLLVYANLKMFEDNPLGTGARSAEVRARYYLPREALNEQGYRSPHNTFLAVLVDQGLPGILLIFAMYGWAAVRLLKMRSLDRRGLPPVFGMFRAAIAGSLAAYVVCSMFINMFRAEVAIWMLALLTVVEPMAYAAVSPAAANEAEKFGATMPAPIRGLS